MTMILPVITILFLLLPFVQGDCNVDAIVLKEDLDPFLLEGKWYLVSMTRLWGINFSPRNFSSPRPGRPTSWNDNARSFFGSWSRRPNSTRDGEGWRGGSGVPRADMINNTNGPRGNGEMGGPRRGWGEGGRPPGEWPRGQDGGAGPRRGWGGGGRPSGEWSRGQDGGAGPQRKWSDERATETNGSNTEDNREGSDNLRGQERGEGSWRGGGWSRGRGMAGVSKQFMDKFRPRNLQFVYKMREDANMDIFIVAEFFTRCIFTQGQGQITNPEHTAKFEVNFPVRWFQPCQPYWIVDTDYVGYSVVYFCLNVLEDGTCDADSVTVWTMNRKASGHTIPEMEKVKKAMERVCVDVDDLATVNQTGQCEVEDEHVETKRNSKPTIHCNNADQQVLRIALDSPYENPNSDARTHSSASTRLPCMGFMFLTVFVALLT